MITKLRQLWQQAFGDEDAFLDSFFRLAYDPAHCRYLTEAGELAAALYWFDCSWDGKHLAYLYAVATQARFQGQGLCRQLMADTHDHLRRLGYDGAVLVPGNESLFQLYEKLGYETFGYVQEFSADAGAPIPLRPLQTAQYAELRAALLPPGGVVQTGVTLDFLADQADFYAGDGFVLAATRQGGCLRVHELLGRSACAPGIVAALGAAQGRFRAPGGKVPFAMFHSLSGCPAPGYFGLALD